MKLKTWEPHSEIGPFHTHSLEQSVVDAMRAVLEESYDVTVTLQTFVVLFVL